MVAYLSGLILLVCVLGLDVSPAQAAQSCLVCHAVHFSERSLCRDCHRGNPASDRKNIAHHNLIAGRYARFTLAADSVLGQGNHLLDQLACRRCHESGGRGNRLATSLDALVEAKPIEEIVAAAKLPARGMPDFRLTDNQITLLINALLAGSKQNKRQTGEQPLAVHFETINLERQDVFSLKCGSCHRILTQQQGLLGIGEIGPNLSGLLSEFYPTSFGVKKYWTQERLRQWLKNPRRIRTFTVMRPVILNEKQLHELETILSIGPL